MLHRSLKQGTIMKLLITILSFIFINQGVFADYIVTGQIRGFGCEGFFIEACKYKKIDAVDDKNGKLIFKDALDEQLGSFAIKKDFKMYPGETSTDNGIFKLGILTDKKIFRITSMDKKLIVPFLEVKQILFKNNEVMKF